MADTKLSAVTEATSWAAADVAYIVTGMGGTPASKRMTQTSLGAGWVVPIIVTSASANAIAVGRQGATSPALLVDASAANSASGLSITAATSGSGVTLAAIGGVSEQLIINARGGGHIGLLTSGTGNVGIGTVSPVARTGYGKPWLCLLSASPGISFIDSGSANVARYISTNAGSMDFGQMQDDGTVPLTHLYLSASGNIGIGQTSFGTNATKTLAVSTGVAPTTSPADAFQCYCADIAAGNAAAHFRTEGGAIIKLYQQALIASPAADAAQLKTAVDAIRTLLINNGLMAAA